MKARANRRFWKLYDLLPRDIQKRAAKAYQLWKKNPAHPGLHFKRVDEEESIYSARVTDDFRVLGALDGDTVIWFWIGTHDEYERMLK